LWKEEKYTLVEKRRKEGEDRDLGIVVEDANNLCMHANNGLRV
jgi:hypothetical protein